MTEAPSISRILTVWTVLLFSRASAGADIADLSILGGRLGMSVEEVRRAVSEELRIDENGSANVYRITHNGVEQNIAIGVGSNGFVVRANPVSTWKPLP
ncbi:hypothetical protein [Pseudomonas nicosulfuronedens]